MSFKTKEGYDMKIVFMGTPDFAVPSLKSLINEFGVEAVFTPNSFIKIGRAHV